MVFGYISALRGSLADQSSSVPLQVKFIASVFYKTRLSFSHLVRFMLPKLFHFIRNINFQAFHAFVVILRFYYWYFILSWKQTGLLYLKWIPMFVSVLSVPSNYKRLVAAVSASSNRRNIVCCSNSLPRCESSYTCRSLRPVSVRSKLAQASYQYR